MKNKNLIDSFNNAINGIIHTIKSERNMKIHITTAVGILILSLLYRITRTEFLIVCIAVAFVLVCELFNTAVEVLVDIIVDVYHPKAKIVKDVAAGAVLISACASLIVGYFIFFDRVSKGLEFGIRSIRQFPMYVTIIALLVTIILTLIFKALNGKGTPFSGGMPSGHAAIAFSITTAVSFLTDNINITILCLLISLLVVQSRLEAKIHNFFEVVAGAVLGLLITLLIFQGFYL